jgi:hypothetical protein
MKRFLTKASLLLLVAFFLTSCGSVYQRVPTPTPTLDPDNPEITITLDEFTFTPDHIRLVVGQHVTLHIINKGEELHEIMIGRNPIRDEDGKLGDGFEHDFFALTEVSVQGDAQVMGMNGEDMNMGEEMNMDMVTATPKGSMEMGMEMNDEHDGEMANGGMVMLDTQKEATITFTVTKEMEGAWTIGCFEGEDLRHFDLGMAGILYVRNFNN